MKTLTELIRAAAQNGEDITIQTDYSGRGMYGRRCFAVVGSEMALRGMIIEIIQEMMSDLASSGTGNAEDMLPDAQGYVDTLLSYDRDSMGRSDIVIYWSDLQEDTAGEDGEEALFVSDTPGG